MAEQTTQRPTAQPASQKENPWSDAVKPVAILVSICAATGFLLGGINNLTLPLITQNREARAWATYTALMPDASNFVAQSTTSAAVTACMKAEGTEGYVIVAQAKGYGGEVPVAVAFSAEGSIESLAVLDNTETPGLGTKIAEESFTSQFVGRTAQPIETNDIDTITGATISSVAALDAINSAIDAYQQTASVQDGAVTQEVRA